jgi:endonuclease/exonuclease/phosphatase family metal-dependent hydrolase
MDVLGIAVWNIGWAAGSRKQNVKQVLTGFAADILCVCEGTSDALPSGGHVICSGDDYGYGIQERRRKVLLWSRLPWSDVDDLGPQVLPPGRFVSATTSTSLGPLRVIGVCIPWRDAHVRTGRRDRKPWQDHLSFLHGLQAILKDSCPVWPAVVVGDFNQRIPPVHVPSCASQSLEEAFRGWTFASAGTISDIGHQVIDHLVHTPALVAVQVRGIDKVGGNGTRLSDHDGIVVTIGRSRLGAASEAHQL